MEERLDEALAAPFCLSLNTPLPLSVAKDLNFLAHAPAAVVMEFRDNQIRAMPQLVRAAAPVDSEWNSLIPPEIMPSAGKLRLDPLLSLMRHRNLGGSNWIQQFLFVFKLTGALSQRYTFPPCEKDSRNTPIGAPRVASENAKRFHERSAKSGFKHVQLIWKETMAQQRHGWLSGAFPLSSIAQHFTFVGAKLNVASRFGAQQAEKLRACDDLRHSMTHLA